MAQLLLLIAWPVLMAYAAFCIVLALGAVRADPRAWGFQISGLGAVTLWWARVLYGLDGSAVLWSFALTVLGVSVMISPKLWSIARRSQSDRSSL